MLGTLRRALRICRAVRPCRALKYDKNKVKSNFVSSLMKFQKFIEKFSLHSLSSFPRAVEGKYRSARNTRYASTKTRAISSIACQNQEGDTFGGSVNFGFFALVAKTWACKGFDMGYGSKFLE